MTCTTKKVSTRLLVLTLFLFWGERLFCEIGYLVCVLAKISYFLIFLLILGNIPLKDINSIGSL
jgi:hypothetical protein